MPDLEFKEFETKKEKKAINFQKFPEEDKIKNEKLIERYTRDEPIAIPIDSNPSASHLSLILSPNLRELELMIRGLEYVKRFNPINQRDEIILRKIEGHPLNEYGINQIMQQLKIYSSPEIKLGRKRQRDYYNSVQHVCRTIVRLVYKNLKNFGMDTQVKQRNAKVFCDAIIEIVDASFSRSVEGRENDASRPTEFSVLGNVDTIGDPTRVITPQKKEQLRN